MSPSRWSRLGKERKQAIILGVLLAVLALVAAINLGLKPWIGRYQTDRQTWTQLQADLDKAERELRRLPQETAAARELALSLDKALRRNLPPAAMPLPQVIKVMQTASAQAGLEWVGYDPISRAEDALPAWVRPPAGPLASGAAVSTNLPSRRLTTYVVRFNLKGAFPDLLDLLTRLENGNPTLNVRACNVSAGRDAHEPLSILLELEWMKTADPQDALLASVRALAGITRSQSDPRFWSSRILRYRAGAAPAFQAWSFDHASALVVGAGMPENAARSDPFAEEQQRLEIADRQPLPAAADEPAAPWDWDGARRQVKVSAVMHVGARSAAVINGLRRTAGQTISLVWKGRRYEWKILSIDEKDVTLEPLGGLTGSPSLEGQPGTGKDSSRDHIPKTE